MTIIQIIQNSQHHCTLHKRLGRQARLTRNIKFYLVFIFSMCIAGLNNLQAQTWLYAEKDGGGDTHLTCKDIAADNSPMGTGNHYTTGDWKAGEINLSGKILSSETASFYVAKYGPMSTKGDIKWVAQGTSNTPVNVKNIVVDKEGNSYVVGELYDDGILSIVGGPSLIGLGPISNFIVKFDPNGNCLYLRNVASTKAESCHIGGLAIDNAGNAYVSGNFPETATFFGGFYGGAGSIVINDGIYSQGGTYIAKFNALGLIEWVHQCGDKQNAFHGSDSKVSVSPSGDCYLTGYFKKVAYFGAAFYIDDVGIAGTILQSTGKFDGYVAKYDTKGNFEWVQQIKNVNSEKTGVFPNSIAIDINGNAYVSGTIGNDGLPIADKESIAGPVNFDGITVIPNDDAKSFLAKYDESGTVQWAKIVGGIIYDDALSIDIDNKNPHLYIAGANGENATFDFQSFNKIGPNQQFNYLVAYDKDGAFSWHKYFSIFHYPLFVNTCRLASDSNNSCYIGATFTNYTSYINQPYSNDLNQLSDHDLQCVALLNVNEKVPTPDPTSGSGKKRIGRNLSDKGPSPMASVYPNPATNLITLSNVKSGAKISIISVMGQVMYHGEALEQIDVSRWPAGVYMVTVNNEQIKFIKK